MAEPDTSANQTSAAANPVPQSPVVNIVIDVGDYDPRGNVSRADHDAYIKKINDSVEALAKQGIPTIYVSIGDNTLAHPGNGPRDPNLLQNLHLSELNVKPGDDVFEKRLMSGFTTPEDIAKSDVLKTYITGQRTDGADYKNAQWGNTTLLDLLQARGAQQVTLMGTVAQYCITDNAIDAARNGLGVTVLSDTIQGWNDKSVHDKVVWNPDDPSFHAAQVASTLAEVKANPKARGIDEADTAKALAAIDTVKISTVDDFIKSQPALTATAAAQPAEPTEPKTPAKSKFMTSPAAAPAAANTPSVDKWGLARFTAGANDQTPAEPVAPAAPVQQQQVAARRPAASKPGM